ncbi:MAG: hypothetical protein V1925_02610, partial [Candidatus Omnitrophota bacterium]
MKQDMIKLFKITGLVVILLSLCLIYISPVFAQAVSITYGQTVSGSIDASGEKDEFTFSGTSTDKITVRFAETSGSLNACAELFNPSGTRITYSTSGRLDSTLAATGTFKIVIRDYGNTATGAYSLSLQLLNNPANATALTFGQTVSGTIGSFTQIKTYSFTVNANDTVTVRTAATQTTSGAFGPYIELYDSTGTLVGYSSSGSLTKKITTAGKACLIITDYSRNGTGTYSLSLQRVNNPGSATALTFGQTVAGTIGSFTQIKAYSFTVNANDTVTVRTA